MLCTEAELLALTNIQPNDMLDENVHLDGAGNVQLGDDGVLDLERVVMQKRNIMLFGSCMMDLEIHLVKSLHG